MKKLIISESVLLRNRNGSIKELTSILRKNSVVEIYEEFAEYNGLVRVKAKNGDEGWVPFCSLED